MNTEDNSSQPVVNSANSTKKGLRRWLSAPFGMRRLHPRTHVIVAIVAILAGLLFSVAAQTAKTSPSLLGVNLRQLVNEQQKELDDKETTVDKLQEQVATLLEKVSYTDDNTAENTLLTQNVGGPGVTVELNDAPLEVTTDSNVSVNDLVVHQQDIDAVMNALWQGGAEAMSVQGIRISPLSTVRCIGNVILVSGQTFAPPYEISAIGDPALLEQALTNDPQVQIYLQYVDYYGLGWTLKTVQTLQLPALNEGLSLQYATVVEDDNAPES